jgi:hypothetical protein
MMWPPKKPTPERTSPLLGVGLLQGRTLTLDYASRTLTID